MIALLRIGLLVIVVFGGLSLFILRQSSAITPDYVSYYVSTAGNNSNDGLTSATAWRTIQHAVDNFDQNKLARIYIAAGIYGEAVTITIPAPGNFQPNNNNLTCPAGDTVYTTSITVAAAGWTIAPCLVAAAGPTQTATQTPAPTNTPTPTQTATATKTPTPTPSPASCPIDVLGTVVSVDHFGTLRCATPTATP